jgi:hypothetical protein
VLVVSNETVAADILRDTIVAHADATEVAVVAPALNTRLRHWTSDEDRARRVAESRLVGCVSALDRAGVHVHGWVGRRPAAGHRGRAGDLPGRRAPDRDAPRGAVELAHDLVGRACARFSLPVVHLVVEDAGARLCVPAAA